MPVAGILHSVEVAPCDLTLDLLKKTAVDDRLVMVLYKDKFLFAVVILFLMGKIIGGDGLFLLQIAAVLFIAQDLEDRSVSPAGASGSGLAAFFAQFPCNDGGPLMLVYVLMKDQLYYFGPFGIDGHLAVPHVVAEH